MRKSKKTNKTINAVHSTLRRFSEAVMVFASLSYMFESDNRVEVGVIAFALVWIITDLALWFYRYFIKPAAVAIASNE